MKATNELDKRYDMNIPKRFAYDAGQRELLQSGLSPSEVLETSDTDTVRAGYKRGLKRLGATAVLAGMAVGGIKVLSVAAERDNAHYQQQINQQERYPTDDEHARNNGQVPPSLEGEAKQAAAEFDQEQQAVSPTDITPVAK